MDIREDILKKACNALFIFILDIYFRHIYYVLVNPTLTPSASGHYEGALDEAKKELVSAVADLGEAQNRALELEQRITDLRHTISVLSKLCGEPEMDIEDSLGLTDAIRSAFLIVGKDGSLTPQEVRLRLEAQGFNTRRYGNLLASIHTVVKRLEVKQEISRNGTKGDKQAYSVTDQGISIAAVKGIGKILAALFLPKSLESKK